MPVLRGCTLKSRRSVLCVQAVPSRGWSHWGFYLRTSWFLNLFNHLFLHHLFLLLLQLFQLHELHLWGVCLSRSVNHFNNSLLFLLRSIWFWGRRDLNFSSDDRFKFFCVFNLFSFVQKFLVFKVLFFLLVGFWSIFRLDFLQRILQLLINSRN